MVLEGGRLALELAIDLPRPRRRTDPRFDLFRRLLLSQLGVREEEESLEAPDRLLLQEIVP